jgi:hypothetical protein
LNSAAGLDNLCVYATSKSRFGQRPIKSALDTCLRYEKGGSRSPPATAMVLLDLIADAVANPNRAPSKTGLCGLNV